jgi:hypothetical protein
MAVAGGDVDQADTGFQGDEVGQDHGHFPVVEGMSQLQAFQAAPLIWAMVSTVSKP